MTDEPIAWMYTKAGYINLPYRLKQPNLVAAGWTETPLYGPEALAARDAWIEELERAVIKAAASGSSC